MPVHAGRRAGREIAPVKTKIKNQNRTEGETLFIMSEKYSIGGEKN